MNLFLNICVLLTLYVGYLGAVEFRCDYSYSKVGWFKYHVIPATWHDARLRCRHEGAMLASPTSTEIKAVMVNSIRYMDIFTGIHAISPGTYRSIDGTPLDAISHVWEDEEPDNKNNAERCIALNSDGKISDVNCNVPRPYMCYKANSLVNLNECGTHDKEYRYMKKTKKCYKFHTVPQTFDKADLICSAEGGHLAVLNSDAESRLVFDLFPKKPEQVIIGANRTDVAFVGFLNWDGEWLTVNGQTLQEAGFSKFFPGEPNNSTVGEYCGSVFRNGFLNDLWCDQRFAFICEKQANYPNICHSDNFSEDSTIRSRF